MILVQAKQYCEVFQLEIALFVDNVFDGFWHDWMLVHQTILYVKFNKAAVEILVSVMGYKILLFIQFDVVRIFLIDRKGIRAQCSH